MGDQVTRRPWGDWVAELAPFDAWNERALMIAFGVFGMPRSLLDVGCGTGAMVNLARNYRAEGMIYHTLRFCDAFSFKTQPIRRFVREKLGSFPFLNIHTEYSSSDVEAVRTRVESFLNIMTSASEERPALAEASPR